MLMYASLFLTGLSIFLVTNLMFQEEDEYKAQEKLESGAGSDKESLAQHGIVLRYSRPFFRRYVTPIVSSFKNKKKIREKYKRNLASAGLTDVLSPEDFFSFKLFLIVGFPIVFLGLRTFLEETWPLNYIFPISILGFFYPDLWIKGKIQERQQEIMRNMPFAVDMLALSVEAGLDFIAAMAKVNEKAKPSALTKEFEILMKEIKIGLKGYKYLDEAIELCTELGMPITEAEIIRTNSTGLVIYNPKKALSLEIRQKRSSDVEKAGATAATKILFPMLFLIVPAVFIVVGAPLALEAMTGGR